jgi:uncharacterized membrane protein
MGENRAKYLFGILLFLYPVLIFCALVIFKFSIRYLSIFIIAFAIAYFLINGRNYKGKNTAVLFISPAILIIIGFVCFFSKTPLVLKMYPALADVTYIVIFVTSLYIPPPLVCYFIEIFDKSIKGKIEPKIFDEYCRMATIVWIIFFVFDGIISVLTVFFVSDLIWGIYNGGITYVIMGLIFVGEFVAVKLIAKRKIANKNLEIIMEVNNENN